MVFQALRHLGQEAVDNQVSAALRRALSAEQRQDFFVTRGTRPTGSRTSSARSLRDKRSW